MTFSSTAWMIARFTFFADIEGSWFGFLPFPMEPIRHVIWILHWGLLLSWLYVLLMPSWAASRSAIQDIMGRIERGEVKDWDQMTAEVNDLSVRLETLWSVSEGGATWVVGLFLASICSLHGVIVYLHGWVHITLYVWISPILNVLLFISLLFFLAQLTSACQDTHALACSIPAAAQRALSSASLATTPEQRRAHLGFILFCRGQVAGIKLLSIQIDFRLVSRVFFTCATILPTLITILRRMMQDKPVFPNPFHSPD